MMAIIGLGILVGITMFVLALSYNDDNFRGK